ncbi:hypothetical protein Emed_004841 [Eimeria media]
MTNQELLRGSLKSSGLSDIHQNRRALQKLMRTVLKWRWLHVGYLKKSCRVQLGNVSLHVEAKELVRFDSCLTTMSTGFFIEEEGSSGREGRLQFIVDASFAESPTPLADVPQDGDDDETQEEAAGPSGSAGMQQSPPQTSPQQSPEASPQSPPQQPLPSPVEEEEQVFDLDDSEETVHEFLAIPGSEVGNASGICA